MKGFIIKYTRVLTMPRDPRYDLIRPKYTRKEIQAFSDLFTTLPKTLVAKDLGKEKGRFNELVRNPKEFQYSELAKFGEDCDLAMDEMFWLIQKQHYNDRPMQIKYKYVQMMYEAKKIKRLEDIFLYVKKSTIAKDLGRKRDTFNRLLHRPDRFRAGDIFSMAELFGLTNDQMIALIKAQLDK
jgi:hypothetical protein